MIQYAPAPTYADPVVVDDITGKSAFNPIWLKWFLDLTNVFTKSGAGTGVIGGAYSTTAATISISGNTILTQAQANNNILEFTGVLTANVSVSVPAALGQWIVYNNTTGAFTLTFKATSGTGLVVEQGFRGLYYFDGTNMDRLDPAVA